MKLTRETIRVLGCVELDHVVGGGGSVGDLRLRMLTCKCPPV
jgi:hypothetical protein